MSNRPYARLLMNALDEDPTVLDAAILPSSAADTIENAVCLRTNGPGKYVVHIANLEGVRKPGEVSYFWGHYFSAESPARRYFEERRMEVLGAHRPADAHAPPIA